MYALSAYDLSIILQFSEAQREEFEDWRHHDDSEDNFCDPEGMTSILSIHARL